MTYSWTQPVCLPCWREEYGMDREPVRLQEPESETCCKCSRPTNHGIYIRVDPTTVPNPTNEK